MTTAINHEKIAARVEARKAALACLDLIDETTNALPSEDSRTAFWDTIHAQIHELMPGLTPEQDAKANGMTASEAVRFELETCPLKKYASVLVGQVPLGYLDYIVGQQTDPENFVNRAARFLKNEQVAQKLREELARDDWRLDQ